MKNDETYKRCISIQNIMGWGDEVLSFEVKKHILNTASISSISVKQNLYVEIDFQWLGSTNTFIITRWTENSTYIAESFRLFFKDQTRDENKFGSIDEDGRLNIKMVQKKNIIRQCCEDVISAIDVIITTYKKCLLDYAVWYRDKRPSGKIRNTYSEFITVIACDCIIHGGILSSTDWKVVEYP